MICSNLKLPFASDSVDEVITNHVPVDTIALHGPGVQSSKVFRILKLGGLWMHNAILRGVKP